MRDREVRQECGRMGDDVCDDGREARSQDEVAQWGVSGEV